METIIQTIQQRLVDLYAELEEESKKQAQRFTPTTSSLLDTAQLNGRIKEATEILELMSTPQGK